MVQTSGYIEFVLMIHKQINGFLWNLMEPGSLGWLKKNPRKGVEATLLEFQERSIVIMDDFCRSRVWTMH